MTCAGLLFGPEPHHLDHLAPLCALAQIPLIVAEEELAEQGQKFYPGLEVLEWTQHEAPEKLLLFFDTVITSTPRALFDEVFFFSQALHNKRIKTIWCPHGNSDKGRNSPFMEGLKEEELLLTYGKRIETFLRSKGVEGATLQIGNYRLAYWEQNRDFYRPMIPMHQKGKTVLYAPTWQDGEKNSSFERVHSLLKETPEEFTLFVKLHPHLYQQYPEEIEQMKGELPSHVTLIEAFPPIYPLLAEVDLLIGDLSSVSYDFLYFNRPILQLERGKTYTAKELFTLCSELLERGRVDRSTLYEETFSPCDLEAIKSLRLQGP